MLFVVRIDILTEGARDWYVLGFGGLNWLPVEKRPEKKQELLEKSKTRYFPAFEKVYITASLTAHHWQK